MDVADVKLSEAVFDDEKKAAALMRAAGFDESLDDGDNLAEEEELEF